MDQKYALDNIFKNKKASDSDKAFWTDESKSPKIYTESPEKMIKKTIQRSLILSLIIVVFCSVLIIFAILKINSLSKDIATKQDEIYVASKQLENSVSTQRIWAQVSPNISKVEATIPKSSDLLGYMGTLQQISKNTQVSQNVSLQNSQSPANPTGGGSTKYTNSLSGNLSSIVNYLIALQKAPYFTQIDGFNITSGDDLNTTATASIQAEVSTYK